MTQNYRLRICENNFAALIDPSKITVSSYLSGYPFSNCVGQTRNKLFKFKGNFIIDNSNNKIYINDGADKTITLVNSSTAYSTGTLLAAHIQTQLNASSSGWTVTYDTTLGTWSFRIQRSPAGTIRLSQTVNAVWNTIGWISTTDLTGTSFYAEAQRNHTEESVIFDLGAPSNITMIALYGPIDQVFSLSNSASVIVQASNVNSFTSPPYAKTLNPTDKGVISALDDVASNYRYWKIKILDQENPNGPNLSIGYFYLGDHTDITSTNVANGFEKTNFDASKVTETESGSLYFDKDVKYSRFESMSVNVLSRVDKDNLEKAFDKLGITTPFVMSLDPTAVISNYTDELTKLVVFNQMPTFRHIIRDIYSCSLSVRELV